MPCGRLLVVLTAFAALVGVTAASGEPVNAYRAAGTPQHVKPTTAAIYTITVTNDPLSPMEADRAKIGIPAGFVVSAASVNAAASAAGSCVASTWVADGTLIAGGKINLKRPGGGGNTGRLCPGATLTVSFSATSSAAGGTYVWATELLRDTSAYLLNGPQPTVEVDGSAPVVTLTSHPPNPSNDTSPSFGFSANEPATFQCKLDGGAFAACTSPRDYSGLPDGSHTFAVTATDAAGNAAVVTYTWLVETTLPIVTLTQQPSPASPSSSATFSFTTSKPAGVQCKLDGGGFAPCSSPADYTGLGEGSHTFTAKATDSAGNTGPETTYAWTIDTVTPEVAITQKPGNPSNDASPSFQFSASEAVGFQCKLDVAAFAPCTSPKGYTPGDGAHTFTVKATDAAGNSDEASYVWTMDTAAPVPAITHKPGSPSNDASPSFEFTVNEAANFQCKLDGGAFASCVSPKTYTPGDGAHTFTVRATDPAGNSGDASYTWTIDTAPPVSSITDKPSPQSNDPTPTFVFASDPGVTFACKLDGAPFAACTSPRTYDPGPGDGAHTFTVRATDAAGNTGPAATATWTIDTIPPVATITGMPDNPSNVKSPTFGFSSEPGAALQCKLDLGGFSPCTSPKTYLNLSDGVHTFTLKAADAAGNVDEATYEWLLETDLPIVTLLQKPDSSTSDSSATFAFIASKLPATLQCRLDGGAFAPCTSPTTFTALADGAHTFAVRAKDNAGNTGPDTVHTWAIDTVGPAAAITQGPSDPTNDRSAAFSFTGNEVGAGFQCRLDGAPFAACAAPQGYSTLPDGRHTFAVRAIDAVGNIGAETSYAWTIDTRAPAVTLTSAPSALSNSGIASFAFSADEPATFLCRLDDGPLEPCTSPTSYGGLGDGGHALSVRATDLAGNAAAVSSSWTIDATPPETTIVSRPSATTKATSARFTFSGRGSSTFECRLDSAPFSRCVSPRSYRRLAVGPHRFAVRAIDAVGNVDPTPSVAAWKVGGATRTVAVTPLFAPAAGALVTKPPVLRWRTARRATYYNVQLYRSGRKVLSAWPSGTRLQLQSSWRFGGRTMRLTAGRYQWYVWPGYGRPLARNYGKLLGSSTFVVGRATTRR